MKTSGIRTPRRPKAAAAAATALTVALLLAVPGATNAAPLDTPSLPGWVAGGQIAPGVERMHLRDEDRVTNKPRTAPRELTVIRIDPSVAAAADRDQHRQEGGHRRDRPRAAHHAGPDAVRGGQRQLLHAGRARSGPEARFRTELRRDRPRR